jgi:hypothetical protein
VRQRWNLVVRRAYIKSTCIEFEPNCCDLAMAQTLIPSVANFVKPSRMVATLSFASMALRISLERMLFPSSLCLPHFSLSNSKSRRTLMLSNSTPVSSRMMRSSPTTIAASVPMQGLHGAHIRIGNKFWIIRLILLSLGISDSYSTSFLAASHYIL